MNAEQLLRQLLTHLEGILEDEYSSDGDCMTGFARGWLGIPLPKNDNESPHRLTEDWNSGVKARRDYEAGSK
jgi:hypothetical protein